MMAQVRVGDVRRLKGSKSIFVVESIIPNDNSCFDWIYVSDGENAVRLWRKTIEKESNLIKHYNTFIEAVNSSEFKGDDNAG